MINIHRQSIIQATLLLTVIAFLSRILGFLREVVIASVFGAKAITDAYLVAQVLPGTLAGLIGGALTTVFIPIFLEEKEKRGEKEAWLAANTVLSASFIYLVIATILAYIFTFPFLRLIAPGFSEDRLSLAVLLTRLILPSLVFHGLLGILTGLSQSYKQFLIPGIGGFLYNICIILSILILGRRVPPFSLALGNVIGVFLQVVLVYMYINKRMPYIRWYIDLSHPAIKKTFYLMIPILIGSSANYINIIIDRIFASGLPEGSISALNFAARVRELPISLFASSMAVAMYPTTSELVINNKNSEAISLLNKTIRYTWLIVIPATIGLIVLDKEIIKLLFERGAFDRVATSLTAGALRYYSLGIFASAVVPIISRVFYSLQDTATPVIVSFLSIGLNISLNAILVKTMRHLGLALATSISGIFSFFILILLLRRKVGSIGGKRLVLDFTRIFSASLFMGGGVLFLKDDILNFDIRWESLSLFLLILIGILIYGIVILILIREERKRLRELIKRIFSIKDRGE